MKRFSLLPIKALIWILAGLASVSDSPSAGRLRDVSPAECMPRVADYTFGSWVNGWQDGRPRPPALVRLQTGHFDAVLDPQRARITALALNRKSASYEGAGREMGAGPPTFEAAELTLSVQIGTNQFRCHRAATQFADWLNFPVRLIDSGRLVQRWDVLQLEFADHAGQLLEAEGRLELIAWPDRLGLILEVTAKTNLMDMALGIELSGGNTKQRLRSGSETAAPLSAGQKRSIALAWLPSTTTSAGSGDVRVIAADGSGQSLTVETDSARGWHRVVLPRRRWNVAEEPDRMERHRVTLENPTDREEVARLLFDAEDGTPGITGVNAMLRDADGLPTGIPVQMSKNWHRRPERPMLYEGPWLHAFTLLRLPARSRVQFEFDLVWARWGGVPAASHAQLSLIGWGWNQLWDQAAIGSWGESICYEPDAIQKRCRIDDIRPLMVWGMGGDGTKWNWTHNVGGGDFLVYYDQQGRYQPLSGVRTAYLSQGPNLTDVQYSGVTADGAIAATLRVASPRCDDVNRAYHRFRYDVLKPIAFERLAFYQLGSDEYNWHQFNRLARGDESGVLEEWSPTRGGQRYQRVAIPGSGRVPWFSLHEGIPRDGGREVRGAWANRGLILRSWKARLGGSEAAPFASVFGTEAGRIPGANLELSAPPTVRTLRPGDFVEADVELVIVPMRAPDYYGPNEAFRLSLESGANTWKPVHRLAAGNALDVMMVRGRLAGAFPIEITVDRHQRAEFEIKGGVGFVPLSFIGLASHRNFRLHTVVDGTTNRLDQSVHGTDFWQAMHDPATKRWRITCNVPMDSPSGRPATRRFLLNPE